MIGDLFLIIINDELIFIIFFINNHRISMLYILFLSLIHLPLYNSFLISLFFYLFSKVQNFDRIW
jgi:hypothetical protein